MPAGEVTNVTAPTQRSGGAAGNRARQRPSLCAGFPAAPAPRAVASETAALMRTLREAGLAPAGAPAAWFYDPPWTIPMLRRNEIAVALQSRS